MNTFNSTRTVIAKKAMGPASLLVAITLISSSIGCSSAPGGDETGEATHNDSVQTQNVAAAAPRTSTTFAPSPALAAAGVSKYVLEHSNTGLTVRAHDAAGGVIGSMQTDVKTEGFLTHINVSTQEGSVSHAYSYVLTAEGNRIASVTGTIDGQPIDMAAVSSSTVPFSPLMREMGGGAAVTLDMAWGPCWTCGAAAVTVAAITAALLAFPAAIPALIAMIQANASIQAIVAYLASIGVAQTVATAVAAMVVGLTAIVINACLECLGLPHLGSGTAAAPAVNPPGTFVTVPTPVLQ